MSRETLVISLGGSVLVPDRINVRFLKNFVRLIKRHLRRYRFIIIPGGGRTAREHIAAASRLTRTKAEDLDWLGIHATRLNAHLLRTVLAGVAFPRILKDPREKVAFDKVLVASGWKPGFSTDYDAVYLAQTYKTKTIVNLTNINYLYTKNPRTHDGARRIKQTTWRVLQNIVGTHWKPGLNTPFDPIATKLARTLKLKLVIIGPDVKNLDLLLRKKPFRGSAVE